MFVLSSTSLSSEKYKEKLKNPQAGGFSSFEGWVRNEHQGRKVIALEYEAFLPLCESEAEKICQEAQEKFSILEVVAVHRIGKLTVGEMAVWIGVTASHRDAAFKACRYIIDEIKKRLPIWKKEFYVDGKSEWVQCAHGQPAVSEQEYYSRQTNLPEVNAQGQARLKAASVLVVGAGGLGTYALTALAQVGVGTLGICEFDRLEASNLHRQPLYSSHDIGQPKVALAEKFLRALNPFVKIKKYAERFTAENYSEIISEYDFILDCTDNFKTKFLLNDLAVLLKKNLVQASIYQFEGQVRVYDPQAVSSCLRCIWSDIPADHCTGNCVEAGVLGFVPAILGNLQAAETIKKILGLPSLSGQDVLLVDLKTYGVTHLRQMKRQDCPLCGSKPTITAIEPSHDTSSLSLTLKKLPPGEYTFVDVRTADERLANPAGNAAVLHFPSGEIGHWQSLLDKEKNYLFFCFKGQRSLKCVEHLRALGFSTVWSVEGAASAVKDYFQSRDAHSIS